MNDKGMKLVPLACLAGLWSVGALAAPVVVFERDIAYQPEALTVHVGDKVRVENKDPFDHKTRVQQQYADGRLGATIVAGHVDKPGASFTFTLDRPGTYEVRCLLHDGMSAVIRVVR